MLIQTAERKHVREVHEQDPTAWWPRNAIDEWWRACKRSDERPEVVALRQLDRWKYRLNYGHHLLLPAFHHHLQQTGGYTVALPLDSISVAALCAYSSTHKLRAAATSPMQVRRSSDSTITTLSFTAANLTDTAGIGTHCGANNGFCSSWTDQSATGISIDNGAGAEPQVYVGAGGTLKTLSNGKFGLAFNGSNQRLGKTTMFGLTGSPALTVAWTMQQTDSDSWCWWLGAGSGAGAYFAVDFYSVARVVGGSGAYREFTYASPIVNPARWVVTKAASGTPSGYTCEQNGTALSQSGITGGSSTMNLSGTNGFRVASDLGDFECCEAVYGMFTMFNAALAGADKTALDAMLSLSVP